MRQAKYQLGDQVNAWTVINLDSARDPNRYEAMCKCGFRRWMSATNLKTIKACRRCSTADKINVGDRFGPSVILKELPREKADRVFIVDCDCGTTHRLRLKTIKARKHCTGLIGDTLGANSAVAQALRAFPGAPRGIKRSKSYELWIWLRREEDAQLCRKWRDSFPAFVRDLAAMLGGSPYDYLSPRIGNVYYTLERIDKNGLWEPENVTARKFFTERAYHRATYLYWRLLGSRDLLPEELKNDYILFLNTFGEKQRGYVLKRRDKRILHSRDNSEWVANGRGSTKPNRGDPDGSANHREDTEAA